MTDKTAPEASLQTLREDIDRIDGEIHRLIRHRADVVARLGALKRAAASAKGDLSSGGMALRPGREAQVLRRLIAAHDGPLPETALFGIWRTMMSAFLRMQSPIEVRVDMSAGDWRIWDLARIHFGAETPIEPCADSAQALDDCRKDGHVLAVLPAPSAGNPWWQALSEGGLMVVAALPFLGARSSDGVQACLVARAVPEASGDDLTWLRIDGGADDTVLAASASKAGLELSPVAAYKASRLVMCSRFLDADDAAFKALSGALAGHGVKVERVGSFARPIPRLIRRSASD